MSASPAQGVQTHSHTDIRVWTVVDHTPSHARALPQVAGHLVFASLLFEIGPASSATAEGGLYSQPQTDITPGMVVVHWPFHRFSLLELAHALGHLVAASLLLEIGPA